MWIMPESSCCREYLQKKSFTQSVSDCVLNVLHLVCRKSSFWLIKVQYTNKKVNFRCFKCRVWSMLTSATHLSCYLLLTQCTQSVNQRDFNGDVVLWVIIVHHWASKLVLEIETAIDINVNRQTCQKMGKLLTRMKNKLNFTQKYILKFLRQLLKWRLGARWSWCCTVSPRLRLSALRAFKTH